MRTKEQKRQQRLRYKAKHPDKVRESKRRQDKRRRERNIANGLTGDGKVRVNTGEAKLRLLERKRLFEIKKVIKLVKLHIKHLKRLEREEKAKNKLSPKERRKQWLASHPNYMENYRKEWKENNPTYNQNHYQANKERYKNNTREYKKKNPDKARAYHKKSKSTPQARAVISVRRRLKDFLGTKLGVKFSAHFGCSKNELLAHLESLFKEGMSWDNYGEVWHIDHIIPLAAAKGNKEVLLKMNHYTNLQPLTLEENALKGDKLPELWPANLPFSKYDLGLHQPWEAPETTVTCYI